MELLYRVCAGLDVHKETVVACVRRVDAKGLATKTGAGDVEEKGTRRQKNNCQESRDKDNGRQARA